MIEKNLVFKKESYQIIGACFQVYKEIGNGFLEGVYQECLALEFDERNLTHVEKPKIRLEYKGTPLEQKYEPDFLCYDKIILEIKTVTKLTDEHRAQVINYIKSSGKKLGLLVNFGHYPKIEYERFVNQSFS